MKKSDSEYILKWSKKIKAVRMLGGKCIHCGNEDVFSLSFHHTDPNTKDDKINDLKNRRWTTIEKEIMKCQLLCHNCHQEFHFDESGLDKRHFELRNNLLKYKGVDRCQQCGYKGKNISSLDFHHVNEKDKLFSIRDVGSGMKEGFDKLAREVDKCAVLCKNCHSKKRIDMERFNVLKEQILYMSENAKEKQKKIDRSIIRDMYFNKKMKQIDISKELKCSKGTICMALREQ